MLALHRVMNAYLYQRHRESVQPGSSQRTWLFYWRPWEVQLSAWSGWWTSGTFFWNKQTNKPKTREFRVKWESLVLFGLILLWQEAWYNHSCFFWGMAEMILTLNSKSGSLKFWDPLCLILWIFLSLDFKQSEHLVSISTVQVGKRWKNWPRLSPGFLNDWNSS